MRRARTRIHPGAPGALHLLHRRAAVVEVADDDGGAFPRRVGRVGVEVDGVGHLFVLDDDRLPWRLRSGRDGCRLGFGRLGFVVVLDLDLVVVDDDQARVVGLVVEPVIDVVVALGRVGDAEQPVDGRVVEVVALLGRHVLLRERGHQLVEDGVGHVLGVVARLVLLVAHSATPSR